MSSTFQMRQADILRNPYDIKMLFTKYPYLNCTDQVSEKFFLLARIYTQEYQLLLAPSVKICASDFHGSLSSLVFECVQWCVPQEG